MEAPGRARAVPPPRTKLLPGSLPALLPALLLALLAGTAGAHGGAGWHQLANSRLCLDEASFAVALEGVADPEFTAAQLRRRLREGVERELQRFEVPFHRAAACGRGRDALRSELALLRWRSEAGAALEYALTLAIQPGGRPRAAPRFRLDASAGFLEAEASAPYLVLLPRFHDAMARDLASAWWEDNPLRRGPPGWAPPALGALLAALVLALGLGARRRRSRAT